jgi:hypothetical protein
MVAGDCSGTCAFTRIARDSANCCTSGGSPGGPANTPTLRLLGVLSCLLLSEFLFFLGQTAWWGSLRVNSRTLLGHTITLTLVLQLLVGTLSVSRKREHADVLCRHDEGRGAAAPSKRSIQGASGSANSRSAEKSGRGNAAQPPGGCRHFPTGICGLHGRTQLFSEVVPLKFEMIRLEAQRAGISVGHATYQELAERQPERHAAVLPRVTFF